MKKKPTYVSTTIEHGSWSETIVRMVPRMKPKKGGRTLWLPFEEMKHLLTDRPLQRPGDIFDGK